MSPQMSDYLGTFEQQVMLSALRQHPNAYGLSIRDDIKEQTGKDYSIGAVYTVLERLKTKGFLKTREGEATAERGGRKKTYFVVTAPGQSALKASLQAISSMMQGTKLAGAFL